MDQIKIGKFIADRRRAVGLTQVQLAERLCVTNKAVSKWECGKAMPDFSIMLKLCEILEIEVTDLLNGETAASCEDKARLEDTLFEMVKQKETSDRQLLKLEWVIFALSMMLIFIPALIAMLIPMEEWQGAIIVLAGLAASMPGFFFAARIEQIAGYYVCGECGHKYVPRLISVCLAAHLGRTRKMRCPCCKKRTWQKKVISKDNDG